jgi:hypothetical protein
MIFIFQKIQYINIYKIFIFMGQSKKIYFI